MRYRLLDRLLGARQPAFIQRIFASSLGTASCVSLLSACLPDGRRGHSCGVAQQPLGPGEARREAGSALTGAALVAGMATGAAIGVAVAGPVGVVVGASLGAVAGPIGGSATGASEVVDETTVARPARGTAAGKVR